MKTSNKILLGAILLALIPSVVVLTSVLKRTNDTLNIIKNLQVCNINVVDARNANIALAPNDRAFAQAGVIWIDNGADEDNIVEVKGDTLIISKHVTRLCIPSVKQLLLPDGVVIEDPFYNKGKD
ncbi:MAG: hypothetical protein IKY93_07025, partial [Alistipes sp.]|nr:hypothetical protein [Alistipes sp.]